jgi:hypothetical protein
MAIRNASNGQRAKHLHQQQQDRPRLATMKARRANVSDTLHHDRQTPMALLGSKQLSNDWYSLQGTYMTPPAA